MINTVVLPDTRTSNTVFLRFVDRQEIRTGSFRPYDQVD